MRINDALINLATDPDYPEYNFQLAQCYEDDKQYAGAISFYLRAAELTYDKLVSYECLLRIYLCFKPLNNRWGIAEGLLLRAVSLIPERPEAYFLLSQYYELNRKWHQSYSYACVGLNLTIEHKPLRTSVGYYGFSGFLFQKAVAGWWIGLYTECISIFRELNDNGSLPDHVSGSVKNNLKVITDKFMKGAKYGKNLEYPYYMHKDANKYFSSLQHRFKFKFPGIEDITENYSQCYQDMFVLACLDGKRYGTYLEIGCGLPKYNSNTYLLESQFGWTGIAIDINSDITKLQKRDRKSMVINMDATKVNYDGMINSDIDYLQIDCEPASTSYEILKRIPFGKNKFAVITFEHEFYIDENREVRDLSREYLKSWGYVMVAGDIAMDDKNSFEDWWVHPDLIKKNIFDMILSESENVTNVVNYMLCAKK